MFNDGTACPTSPGIYPYQVDYLESEIDTVTGIMTFNETITRNGEATSVTWRGENNNAQYDVAPAPVAGTYVDLEYSNTVTVDNNGQFTYVLTGSPSSDYFSATLTAAKDKNYYTINGGYSIFGTDISGYAIPTDFYGDTRLVVNFFGDQIQGDSLPPLKSGLSRVWTPLQQE